MRETIIISRFICIFLGVIDLFGQFFFSTFDILHTLSGLSGLFVGSLAKNSSVPKYFLVSIGVLGIFALITDAYHYYISEQVPGNYYAWPESLLFGIALLVVIFFSHKIYPDKRGT